MTTNGTWTVALLLLAACGSETSSGRMPAGGSLGPGSDEDGLRPIRTSSAAAGVENTFDHPAAIGGGATSAREALERMEEQGPPGYAARVHACRKIRYRTLGNLLASRGVNLETTGDTEAGAMWRAADQALGAPNYGARIAESSELTVAVASRMFDIYVQAAPEIIANVPSRPECMIGTTPAQLFDASGRCVESGLSCVLGLPASAAHVALCNDVVSRADDPEQGKVLAIAALLSASQTCE